MPNLKPSDIVEDVRLVLAQAPAGKGVDRSFMTAYQILDRLPPATRERLIRERGAGGKVRGSSFPAGRVVSVAIEMMSGVEIFFLDTQDITLRMNGTDIEPGNRLCGLYRLR